LVNSLGTPASRAVYPRSLDRLFRRHEAALDEDSKRRLQGNPLRILDSKNPEMQRIVAGAPSMLEALDAESKAHFEELADTLRSAGIEYDVEPRLVRGLDYYTRTVFEWTTDALGSQSTVCAGGRYDGLVAQLGGPSTPGIGWAMGQERIVMLLEKQAADLAPAIGRTSIWCWLGSGPRFQGFKLAEQVRDAWPDLGCRSIWAAAVSRRNSSAPTRAARSSRSFWETTSWPGGRGAEGLAREMAQEECPIAQISERLGTLLGLTGA
jgi:histidyl-tRNA synthetase